MDEHSQPSSSNPASAKGDEGASASVVLCCVSKMNVSSEEAVATLAEAARICKRSAVTEGKRL